MKGHKLSSLLSCKFNLIEVWIISPWCSWHENAKNSAGFIKSN
jgi:hypothetical protein